MTSEQSSRPQQRLHQALEPTHLTEFGSPRYIEKLAQQQDGTQTQTTTQAQTQLPSQPSSGSIDASIHSNFILPLRETRTGDIESAKPQGLRRDKKSIFNLRSKVSLFPSKHAHQHEGLSLPIRTSSDGSRRTILFSQRFLSLPNELQIQVLSYLPLTDILNLRATSRSWHALISANEATIARLHLEQQIPAYAKRLYPVDQSSGLNFHYLCGLWHRLHVAAKLSHQICQWVTKDIFLRQTAEQRLTFAPQTERMRRRLIPLLFTIFHFFETYRKLHLDYIRTHGHGLQQEPYTLNPIEKEIMAMYDDKTLLRVHEVFPLVMSSFGRRLRPPTYVGRVERSLRGYIREKPSDDVHVAILTIGGLREVERLWEIKGYNTRRGAVDTWFNALTKESPSAAEATSTKSRRGLMGFGRKKSTTGEREHRRPSLGDRWSGDALGRRTSTSADQGPSFDPSWIFNGSLAAGAPMAALPMDQAQDLLGDLPVLQHIWTMTAEALILDRKVVERAQDIRRNQTVILDLIGEHGLDEEDEWWYGRAAPESVRPAAALDDDAD